MLHLRCFGQVVIVDDSGEERSLRSRKHLGLLIYLMAHRRTTHPREDLADLLWDGAGPKERHSLSQALYDIRTHAPDLLAVSTTSVAVVSDRMTYEAQMFEEAVESGDHETALDLYRGEFAPDLMGLGAEMFDRWVDREREGCRVLASVALRNAQRAAEERGDWDRMCLASLRLVRLNEFDEEAHCALMRGLWMKGDPASALRHYRALDDDLKSGWRAAAELAERLKDSGAVREVLNPAPSSLLGRSQEFAKLSRATRELAAPGGVILVVGPRGIGKTALIEEFARRCGVEGAVVERGPGAIQEVAEGEESTRLRLLIVDEGRRLATDSLVRSARTVLLVESSDVRGAWQARDAGMVDTLIRLTPLPSDCVEKVISGRVGPMDAQSVGLVGALSAGNPMLLLTIGRALRDNPIPRGALRPPAGLAAQHLLAVSAAVRELLRDWLGSLSDSERQLLTKLAVWNPTTGFLLHRSALGSRERADLETLEMSGWVEVSEGRVSIIPPLLRDALATWVPVAERVSVSRDAASALGEISGKLKTEEAVEPEYLRAAELAAAGDRAAAFEQSLASARQACSMGQTELAQRAAQLAIAQAANAEDRFEAAIIQARVELGRGNAAKAETLVRSVRSHAASDEARLQAQLTLLRALIALESRSELLDELPAAVRLAETASDRQSASLARLAIAEARFVAAVGRRDELVDGLASELGTALRDSSQHASSAPEAWQSSFRSLFLHNLISVSRSKAEVLLDRFTRVLCDTQHPRARHAADLGRAAVEARAGRLHTAHGMLKGMAVDARENDRYRAVTLNNLGVVLTELGKFELAQGVLAEVSDLDRTLLSCEREQIHTMLNLAQAAWFMGDRLRSEQRATQALARASRSGDFFLEAEAVAVLGLMAWERGDVRGVHRLSERLDGIERWTSRIQDRYLVSWFRAVAQQLGGINPSDALLESAHIAAETDELAATKLRYLAASLRDDSELSRRSVATLRRSGAGWFVRRVATLPS